MHCNAPGSPWSMRGRLGRPSRIAALPADTRHVPERSMIWHGKVDDMARKGRSRSRAPLEIRFRTCHLQGKRPWSLQLHGMIATEGEEPRAVSTKQHFDAAVGEGKGVE
eukprot:1566976-Pleurochrysis_carterae.AAC.1